MDAGYYGSLIMLNIAFLLKYGYYKSDQRVIIDLLEEIITILICLMLLILAIKLIYESVPWSWLKKLRVEEAKDDITDQSQKAS